MRLGQDRLKPASRRRFSLLAVLTVMTAGPSLLRFAPAWAAKDSSYENYRWAIETDNLPTFQNLVRRGLGPNLIMPDGNPALVYAMQQGSTEIVRWLIQHPDLQVNLRNARGDTALMTAASLGEVSWVEQLGRRGGELGAPDGQWSAMHFAAAANRLSVVQYLKGRRDVRLDALSANGTTPLMMAARSNALEIVRYLLEQGARADLENEAGLSALAYARRNGNEEMEILLRSYLRKTIK